MLSIDELNPPTTATERRVRVEQSSKIDEYFDGTLIVTEIRIKRSRIGDGHICYEVELLNSDKWLPSEFKSHDSPLASFGSSIYRLWLELREALDLDDLWEDAEFKKIKFLHGDIAEGLIGCSATIRKPLSEFTSQGGKEIYASLTIPELQPAQIATKQKDLQLALQEFHREVLAYIAGDRAVRKLPQQLTIDGAIAEAQEGDRHE